jgi:hypothetical protein
MPLVILGRHQDLEPAVIAVRTGYPVGVDGLHPPRLLTCTWHDISKQQAGRRPQLIRAWAYLESR